MYRIKNIAQAPVFMFRFSFLFKRKTDQTEKQVFLNIFMSEILQEFLLSHLFFIIALRVTSLNYFLIKIYCNMSQLQYFIQDPIFSTPVYSDHYKHQKCLYYCYFSILFRMAEMLSLVAAVFMSLKRLQASETAVLLCQPKQLQIFAHNASLSDLLNTTYDLKISFFFILDTNTYAYL